MNTNMSSANGNTNGNTNDTTKSTIIGGVIVNSKALQLLIASKNDAEIAAFEATGGWTWQDACETSLATETATLLASKNAEEIAAFEAIGGWSWSDAVDETILAAVEARLREISQEASDESDADTFERENGWTYGDAVDMAAELRREDRIFGRRVH